MRNILSFLFSFALILTSLSPSASWAQEEDERADARDVSTLTAEIARLEKMKDAPSAVRAMLSLAKIHRAQKQHFQAATVLKRAAALADTLKGHGEDPLKVYAYSALGDSYLRAADNSRALQSYTKAFKIATPKDPHESSVKILERMAWAHRGLGHTAEATKLTRQAVALAQKNFGRGSAAYRMGLTELAVLAIDRNDVKELQKIQKELDTLQTSGPTAFARHLSRLAMHQCRRAKQTQQEELIKTQLKIMTSKRPVREV